MGVFEDICFFLGFGVIFILVFVKVWVFYGEESVSRESFLVFFFGFIGYFFIVFIVFRVVFFKS